MAILIAILLFALGYTRLVGSSQEQRTAIEAASLAAAKEISRIVVNDPNFGYISLSDAAPVGKATAAGDNFFIACLRAQHNHGNDQTRSDYR